MNNTTSKRILTDLQKLILEKRAELRRLEAAQMLLDSSETSEPKANGRKPSNEAINAGKVSTGGRLRGYRVHIQRVLQGSNGMTSSQISSRLFERGLGMSKAVFERKISSTLHAMRVSKLVNSKKQKGKRAVIWKID